MDLDTEASKNSSTTSEKEGRQPERAPSLMRLDLKQDLPEEIRQDGKRRRTSERGRICLNGGEPRLQRLARCFTESGHRGNDTTSSALSRGIRECDRDQYVWMLDGDYNVKKFKDGWMSILDGCDKSLVKQLRHASASNQSDDAIHKLFLCPIKLSNSLRRKLQRLREVLPPHR
ncbi:unnamed protein product [Amoebophrya sp. A25]|nr:unnamed protein product [Amoebophrya sp. A25]|eukprot:GSA25T00014616001.1